MRAYIDESATVTPPGLYVMPAVVVPDERAEDVRWQLRENLLPRQRRIHWRDENAARRHDITKRIADLRLPAIVVTISPLHRRGQERARRLCLMRLLWELGQRDVYDVVIESRQENLNREDRQFIAGAVRAKQLEPLLYGFERPGDEPLLWLPDTVAGAVAAAEMDGDDGYVRALSASVELIRLGGG